MEIFDIIIVGAGISGLTAAYELLKANKALNICIFEANDRIGGRTCGEDMVTSKGIHKFDFGGQWIGSCQKEIYALLDELSIDTFPQFTSGKKLILYDDQKRIVSYKSNIPRLNFFVLLDIYWFLYKVNRLSDKLCLNGIDSISSSALQFDQITLLTFLEQTLWTNDAKNVIDASIRCIFGAEACTISFLYFLNYIKCAGGIEPLLNSSKKFGGQELRVKGGAWTICHVLLSKLKNITLHTLTPVTSITQTANGVYVVSENIKYFCKYVIVSIPLNLILDLQLEPPLPDIKKYLLQRQSIGSLRKIIITYKSAFWRHYGFSGEIVCNSRILPICIVFDATLDDDATAALVCFIGGEQENEFKLLDADKRKKIVLNGLLLFFGPDVLHPVDYKEKNWAEEKYIGGCPVSNTKPWSLTDKVLYGNILRQPHGRIHFAGTEMASSWCGFMNGAVQSAQIAANQVLRSIDPNHQSVNQNLVDSNKNNDSKFFQYLYSFFWTIMQYTIYL